MDKKDVQYKVLTSKGGKWELVGTKDVTLTYVHDKTRMMRNSITFTYAELEELLSLLSPLNKTA